MNARQEEQIRMAKITIITTQQTSDIDQDTQRVVPMMRIKWRIDQKHGPYVNLYPLDTFDADKTRRELEVQADNILKLQAS